MQPRIPRPLVLLLVALALAGCGRSGFRPFTLVAPPPPRIPAEIDAVAAPDSVSAGQPFVVKIRFYNWGCGWSPDPDWVARGDSLFVNAMLVRVPWIGACPDIVFEEEKDCVVSLPREGAWTIAVNALDRNGQPTRLTLPLVAGAAPAAVRRFDVRVVDEVTRDAVPGTRVTLLKDTAAWPPDTLADLVTDGEGRAARTLGCAAVDSGYVAFVELPPHPNIPRMYCWSPARCGVPERAVYLVRSPAGPRAPMRRSLAIHYR